MSITNTVMMGVSPSGLKHQIDLLAKEAGETKHVREIIMNGFEAIVAKIEALSHNKAALNKYQPQMSVTEDRYYKKQHKVSKVSYIDNGIGMDLERLLRFNQYSDTGKTQGLLENFGIGAKITTLPFNPYGIEIRSWKSGVGNRIIIHLDETSPDEKKRGYGLKEFIWEDGTRSDYDAIDGTDDGDNLMKPDIIDQNGTVVVLLGKSLEDNTLEAPVGAEGGEKSWHPYLVNKTFFEIPNGIKLSSYSVVGNTIQARGSGRKKDGSDRIMGYKALLEKEAKLSGSVDLDDVIAHWWVIATNQKERTALHNRYLTTFPSFTNLNSVATVGFMHRISKTVNVREIIDFRTSARGSNATNILKDFGIYEGHQNVIVFIEPKSDLTIFTNAARTAVLFENEFGMTTSYQGLPWADWAEKFNERMPAELVEYVHSQSKTDSKDREAIIKDYLERNIQDIAEQIFGEGNGAACDVKDEKVTVMKRSRVKERREENDPNAPASPKNKDRSTDTNSASPESRGKSKLKAYISANMPRVDWVNSNDDDQYLELTNKAGRYHGASHFLEINSDFYAIKELIGRHSSHLQAPHNTNKKFIAEIQKTCEAVYAGHLIQSLLILRQKSKNQAGWNREALTLATSPEGLSSMMASTHQLSKTLNVMLSKTIPAYRVKD